MFQLYKVPKRQTWNVKPFVYISISVFLHQKCEVWANIQPL